MFIHVPRIISPGDQTHSHANGGTLATPSAAPSLSPAPPYSPLSPLRGLPSATHTYCLYANCIWNIIINVKDSHFNLAYIVWMLSTFHSILYSYYTQYIQHYHNCIHTIVITGFPGYLHSTHGLPTNPTRNPLPSVPQPWTPLTQPPHLPTTSPTLPILFLLPRTLSKHAHTRKHKCTRNNEGTRTERHTWTHSSNYTVYTFSFSNIAMIYMFKYVSRVIVIQHYLFSYEIILMINK